MNNENKEHRLIKQMLTAQSRLQTILHEHKEHMLLPMDAAREIATAVDVVLACYSHLANEADKHPARRLWNVAPTHHVLFH